MLREVVEQYHRRYMITNRSLSSHRAPFECRRRPLGKRHMTDMLESPPAYRPTWWFELLGDRYAWEWKSPTTQQQRRDKEGRITLSGLWDKCVKWLEASDLDKPFLVPPSEAAAADSAAQDALETPAQASTHEASLDKIMTVLRSELTRLGSITDPHLDKLLGRCCRDLRSALCDGDFTSDQIYAVLEPVEPPKPAPRRGDLSHGQYQSVNRSIANTVLSTIMAMRRLNRGMLYDEAWAVIVDRAFSMPQKDSRYRLFNYMVSVANPVDLEAIDTSLYQQMARDFVWTHGNKLADKQRLSLWSIRASLFALSLERLPMAKLRAVCEAVEGDIWNSDGPRHQQFTWLIMKAQLSQSTREEIAEMTLEYKETHGDMALFDVRKLATARLVAEGTLDLSLIFPLVKVPYKLGSSHWTILAELVLIRGGLEPLKSLLQWLELVGEPTCLLRSLVLAQLQPEHGRLVRSSRLVMEKMMEDPELKSHKLAVEVNFVRHLTLQESAGTLQPPGSLRGNAEMMDREVMQRSMKDLLEWLAHWYMVSPDLTDRQAQRGVEWCMRQYAAMTRDAKGSSKILAILAKVLVRDLSRGNWGRTERLDWLVLMIEKNQGAEQAEGVLKTLRGWRHMLQEQKRERYQRLV